MGGHISCNYRLISNDCTTANSYTLKDANIAANKHIVFNNNWTALTGLARLPFGYNEWVKVAVIYFNSCTN